MEQQGVPVQPQRTAALEDFIARFNAAESEGGLFDSCIDDHGFPWWDVARYRVQFALCQAIGVHGRSAGASQPLPHRLLGLGRRATEALAAGASLAGGDLRQVQALYVYGRVATSIVDALRGGAAVAAVVSKTAERGLHPAWWASKPGVDLLGQNLARFFPMPNTLEQQANRVQQLIQAAFGASLDCRPIMRSKFARHQADAAIWSRLLDRAPGLQQLHYVNDDTLKTLTALCRARGIFVSEHQHAYMGRSHIAFSHPPDAASLPTLPDEVMISRDTGDITYPVAARRALSSRGGCTALVDEPRTIDVLVGGSPTRNAEALAILRAIAGRGWRIGLKLHPAQSVADTGVRKAFSAKEVEVFGPAEDFCGLARRALVYVPANPTSTTSFEAVENGARLVIVDDGGASSTSMLDGVRAHRAPSIEATADVIAAMLPAMHAAQTSSEQRR